MIYKSNNIKKAEKAPAFPLGVSLKDGILRAAVSVQGGKYCRILLREYIPSRELTENKSDTSAENGKKGKNGCGTEYSSWDVYELAPAPVFTGIYTGSIKLEPFKRYEYIFENEDGYFLDERAVKINHNDSFGGFLGTYPKKPDSDVAKILSDTMGFACMAEEDEFDWEDDRQPDTDYSDLILYKLHVRGFTVHASSGVKHPGTYKGITEKISYLQKLGINGIILQPCVEFNEFMDYGINIGADIEQDVFRSRFRPYVNRIVESRLNFWGYGAQSFYFAPKASYASEPDKACNEMKEMVKKLHKAGIEVIMEMDFGKCNEPSFVIDSLIYWVRDYHIDGFRVNAGQVPMSLIVSNPYLCNVKLISQSIDGEVFSHLKPGNRYHLAVANDAFQNTMRRFVKGDEGQLKYVSDYLMKNSKEPAFINFMADHDGFTLNDVYSYDERHNELNGERNRDGRDMNYSWNCGTEGPTKKRRITDLRNKMIKNALSVLFLSAGTPMLMSGDEFGNTHEGNNNPYCCDNRQGWVIWDKSKRAAELKAFCEQLIDLRRQCGIFCRTEAFSGRDPLMKGMPDISFHGINAWNPDFSYYSRTLCIFLNGDYARIRENGKNKAEKKDTDLRGISENSDIYVIFNMHWDEHEFGLPAADCINWKRIMVSGQPNESASDLFTENIRALIKSVDDTEIGENPKTAVTKAAENNNGSEKKTSEETADEKVLTGVKVPPRSVAILVGSRYKVTVQGLDKTHS